MSKAVPILLIHGFNGSLEQLEASGLRADLIQRGAEPDLVRYLHYGWFEDEAAPVAAPPAPRRELLLASRLGVLSATPEAASRRYNNQADIRHIAARLSRRDTADRDALRSQVTRLSEDSVARGGPAKVTLLAHSMGGLVARYYLSRRAPDEWGTVNEGVVGRLITIGTPHLGARLARISRLVPPDAFIWTVLRWFDRLPFVRGKPSAELADVDALAQAMQQRSQDEEIPVSAQGFFDSVAVQQMIPDSPFMQALNAPGAFPADVESALVWGDVQFTASVRLGALPLWERRLSLGDLLIAAASAGGLTGATQRFPFVWERRYTVQIGDPAFAPAGLADFLPPVQHSNLLRNEQVYATVARLVGL